MEAQAQAMLMDGQSKMARAENEKAKIALDAERLKIEAQYKQAENFMKAEMERLKAMIHQHKSEVDVTGKVLDMQSARKAEEHKQAMEALQMRMDQMNAEKDRALEYFKVLATSQGKPGSMEEIDAENQKAESERKAKQEQDANEAARQAIEARNIMESQMRDSVIAHIYERINEMNGPKVMEYDENGLMKSMGGKPVVRDADGRVIQVG